MFVKRLFQWFFSPFTMAVCTPVHTQTSLCPSLLCHCLPSRPSLSLAYWDWEASNPTFRLARKPLIAVLPFALRILSQGLRLAGTGVWWSDWLLNSCGTNQNSCPDPTPHQPHSIANKRYRALWQVRTLGWRGKDFLWYWWSSIFNLLFLKNFYLSAVDLQCCVCFRCTAKWISYT